ncbi:related to IFRD domain [Lecanosticta acicola]|uniref:Related to IFRD domain n=1 Tax=Lecanosticta acicola TaxID=111012 RepID=A0AAI8YWE5_9PEZI|nr:related to IFRD domain [Lecanosticta acicola]
MHDLRKQVLLESGKTVSKKARSKTSTPPQSRTVSRGNSTTASPAGSRVQSRAGSEDEAEFSDGTEWSTNSLDASLVEETDEGDEAWAADLDERIEAIIDRKRSSTEGREQRIARLITTMSHHFVQKELKPKLNELLSALLKSVKGGQSEAETCLALKALALLLVTDPSEDIYDEVQRPFKSTIDDSEDSTAKIAAIHALSIATFYGGASLDETQEVMDYFLDIASSDGANIGEEDNAQVVVACLREWGFLATQLDDLEDVTENAMDTFVDQLESNDVGVQVAAGDNIALLYEASAGDSDSDDEDDSEATHQRYTVYRQSHQLQKTLEGLAKSASKRISKQDRKQMHVQFRDVLNTVEDPSRGPRYNTAFDPVTGREYGSRMKVAIHRAGANRSSFMIIDKWWKLHRLNGLKRLLQGGFLVHYEFNQAVYETLSVSVEDD